MTTITDKSVGQIVAEDYRTAQVFKDHKIDFCCNGGRSIQEVAREKGLNPQTLLEEVDAARQQADNGAGDFESWPLDLLADYVVKTHHRYAEKQTQVLKPYLDKICKVHGGRHPELFEVKAIFDTISGEMAAHMKREELMLFPFIKKIVSAADKGETVDKSTGRTVENPVNMMKHEHDDQGEAFRKIAELTNDYTPPADACNTYKVTFGLLSDFENDLHKHIHLENNILFPKAIALEKELSV